MFDTFQRWLSILRGDGEAAITVPAWDGALKPNRLLDEAEVVAHAAAPTDLVAHQDRIWLADGSALLQADGNGRKAIQLHQPIVAAAASQEDQLALGLEDGTARVLRKDGSVRAELRDVGVAAALAFEDEDTLLIARASARHGRADFARSLLEKDRSGSVARWRIGEAATALVADRLAYAFGVASAAGGQTIIAESWRHHLLQVNPYGHNSSLLADLPAYPSRLIPSQRGGWWLTCFCARFQLLEFVLRERRYREEMMRSVEPAFWIAPKLRSGQDWREPLQGAGIQQMGVRKPWAPPQSYGLVVYLDAEFRPRASLHSRTDGMRHGVVAVAEAANGDLYALSAGTRAVLKLRSDTLTSLLEGALT